MTNQTPIILIPGLGASPRTYSKLIPTLWKHGAVTLANQKEEDSMEALAHHILVTAPEEFVLIGHSMGGYIAFEIMRQAPGRVTRLILMNTSAHPDNPEAAEKRKKQIEQVKAEGFAKLVNEAFPKFVHPSNTSNTEYEEIIWKAHEDAGVDAFVNQQTAIMNRKDSRPDLANIKVPTLVISSDADQIIKNELSKEIADAIPSAKFHIIKNAGHMSAIEQPEAISKVIDEWMSA